ncbi:hypothetical protein FQR65_LT07520 [Abscondita terminalis]|nr:hypothetical protein FQR65_LT07520 [Abscondita terminalis]
MEQDMYCKRGGDAREEVEKRKKEEEEESPLDIQEVLCAVFDKHHDITAREDKIQYVTWNRPAIFKARLDSITTVVYSHHLETVSVFAIEYNQQYQQSLKQFVITSGSPA